MSRQRERRQTTKACYPVVHSQNRIHCALYNHENWICCFPSFIHRPCKGWKFPSNTQIQRQAETRPFVSGERETTEHEKSSKREEQKTLELIENSEQEQKTSAADPTMLDTTFHVAIYYRLLIFNVCFFLIHCWCRRNCAWGTLGVKSLISIASHSDDNDGRPRGKSEQRGDERRWNYSRVIYSNTLNCGIVVLWVILITIPAHCRYIDFVSLCRSARTLINHRSVGGAEDTFDR